MRTVAVENSFSSWRVAARHLLSESVPPAEIVWTSASQGSLFGGSIRDDPADTFRVPSAFVKLAAAAGCYDDIAKWPLLYRILYRLQTENRNLLQIESDPDVREAAILQKAVNRDIHKFHAFVRFRTVEVDGEEIYTAWHEPQHWTVEAAAPFFARRFGSMRWSILTPRGCAHWNTRELTFSPAVTRDQAPQEDATEEFWLTYYRSIFNPFRLSLKTMKQEMPMRHWQTLPEAALIREMVRETNAWSPDASAQDNKRQSTKPPR